MASSSQSWINFTSDEEDEEYCQNLFWIEEDDMTLPCGTPFAVLKIQTIQTYYISI